MDELDARFELLRDELNQIQEGIRSHDQILVQIRGWAVTVGLAAGGFSLTSDSRAIALLGVFAAAAFWIIDSHRRMWQRRIRDRAKALEAGLRRGSIAEFLNSGDSGVPGIAHAMTKPALAVRWREFSRAAGQSSTWTLYVALAAVLVVIAVR